MKTFKNLMLMLTLVFSIASCSSDNDNDNDDTVNTSREVKYEVTGNFSGELDASYLEKSGAPLIEDITALPWTKEFTADANSDGALVHASGYGGVSGQTVTAKVIVGGKVVSELTGTANSDGIIVVHPKTYVFPR